MLMNEPQTNVCRGSGTPSSSPASEGYAVAAGSPAAPGKAPRNWSRLLRPAKQGQRPTGNLSNSTIKKHSKLLPASHKDAVDHL